jgi:hypothetical protein
MRCVKTDGTGSKHGCSCLSLLRRRTSEVVFGHHRAEAPIKASIGVDEHTHYSKIAMRVRGVRIW